jgi:ribulose-bisphosphate carboxylase large chain
MNDIPAESLHLATTLKALMAERQLTGAQLARQAGLSMASLSRILSGQTNPSFESVVKLAAALNISLSRLSPPTTSTQPKSRAGHFPLHAKYVLENTDLTTENARQLLHQAANGVWVASPVDDYIAPQTTQAEVTSCSQVGTRRLQLEVSFPLDMLEEGSLAGILSVAGSALTGTGAKLLDIRIPEPLLRSFSGPAFGARGLRDTFNKHGRPLLAATIRPMHGLSPRQYGRMIYETLIGGIDTTADPTLLHSIPSSTWRERFRFAAEASAAATRETNEFKTHMVNISASTMAGMEERALWARDLEMACVMVDSAAIGWTAMQSITAFCAKHDLLVAAMGGRALGGDMLSEQLQAKLLRFAGADIVSTGSPLRGNVANRRYVLGVLAALRDEDLPLSPESGHYVAQPLAGLNASMPAVGGGHNPWHFPRLLDAIGPHSLIQCGGSVMGHPQGPQAGANACRTALEALVQAQAEGLNLNVEGRHTLQRAAKYSPELRQALEYFQEGSFLFGIIHSLPRPTEGSVLAAPTNPSPSIAPVATITPFRKPEAPNSDDDNESDPA